MKLVIVLCVVGLFMMVLSLPPIVTYLQTGRGWVRRPAIIASPIFAIGATLLMINVYYGIHRLNGSWPGERPLVGCLKTDTLRSCERLEELATGSGLRYNE